MVEVTLGLKYVKFYVYISFAVNTIMGVLLQESHKIHGLVTFLRNNPQTTASFLALNHSLFNKLSFILIHALSIFELFLKFID